LVLGENGEKLSKQNGAYAVDLRDPLGCAESRGGVGVGDVRGVFGRGFAKMDTDVVIEQKLGSSPTQIAHDNLQRFLVNTFYVHRRFSRDHTEPNT
jgi:hypothetical protein